MRNTILTAAALVLFSSAAMAQSTGTRSPPTTGPAAQSDKMLKGDVDMTKDKMSKKKKPKSAKMKKSESSEPASALENSRATIMATDFSARRRYRRAVRYAPRYYRQRYVEERYYAEPVYSSPAYSSYGWHSGVHHNWHSGAHFGQHDELHYDPYNGVHAGEHYGPHS